MHQNMWESARDISVGVACNMKQLRSWCDVITDN